MAVREPPLSIGIEEEYLLVDRASRDVVADPPRTMMKECEALLTGQVSPEFLRSQIEVETRIYGTVGEARADLANLRATVAKVADKYGLASLAAGTHPFATWADQKHTDAERYNVLARDLQGVARRLMTCGLHVHVGIDDDDLRIDLMNQVAYFLPTCWRCPPHRRFGTARTAVSCRTGSRCSTACRAPGSPTASIRTVSTSASSPA